MKKFKVALLANLKKNAPHFEGMAADQWDDLDSETTIRALVDAICAGGHICEFLEGDVSLYKTVKKFNPDICFNICEGHFGDSREAQVPAILEMLQIPYTGSRVLTLALALDKPMTKRILHYHELPTPPFQVFERADEPLNDDLKYPLFAKPSREGTGMGVSGKSIIKTEAELREQVNFIINRYRQPALVEQYIEGREVTVGLVGNLQGPVAQRLPDDEEAPRIIAGLKFLPPMEVDLKPYWDTDVVYSNRLKVALADKLDYLCPAPITREMVEELNWLTAAVFRVTGALDVSRVDFRLDAHNNWKPYILEINPLPGLTPVISDLVIEAAALGIGHTELVNSILETALARYGMI
ncbi:MAG: D-alanine--D-alanine ligase family protein [Omnitrophica WOR_2 bacterium]